MASPSKENNILRLLLENTPLKQWHFATIVKEAKVTKAVANKWLKKYVAQGLLLYIKEDKRFPYYTVGKNNPVYYACKRVYALQQLHDCGLFAKLLSLPAKTIILFGSMNKGDWYKDSDIDIFIFGDISGFDRISYEILLSRHIELHIFANKRELQEVRSGLLQNVVNGYVIKGHILDVLEII